MLEDIECLKRQIVEMQEKKESICKKLESVKPTYEGVLDFEAGTLKKQLKCVQSDLLRLKAQLNPDIIA